MACPLCLADPMPRYFGSPRKCAFNEDGSFNQDNWNCATISSLLVFVNDRKGDIHGNDESMQLIYAYQDVDGEMMGNGWIVLTRYKQRGRTDSAVHVGQFWPPRPLTLAMAEELLPLLRAAAGRV